MIGLSAKRPGTLGRWSEARGSTASAGLAAAGDAGPWHAPAAIAISGASQQLVRNRLLARRCIVESRSRPTALLLFSTALSGYRAFRNAATRVTIAAMPRTMSPLPVALAALGLFAAAP